MEFFDMALKFNGERNDLSPSHAKEQGNLTAFYSLFVTIQHG